jgi:hypothetical protein
MNRIVAYAWAGPNSLLGLAASLLPILLGARARVVRGVIEVSGGWLGAALASPAVACPFRAITLGHVILATDDAALECSRAHERVHVRQYERWGPFFLPAYVISSAWQLLRGRRCYQDNHFERQACDRARHPEELT